jgi:hypothetical protein
MVTTSELLHVRQGAREMLAEIFILQLETTLRANNEESTHAPKFVPVDWTTGAGAMFDVSCFARRTRRRPDE